MKKNLHLICFLLMSIATSLFSQKEFNNWYFGTNAGLSFSTTPPTVLTNGSLISYEPGTSISDAAGNLLFYTEGVNVWNKLHLVMPNGSGLLGGASAAQSGMIVKMPGSANIFYIFTTDEVGGINGLRYSTVDMSLAGGNGDVVAKNVLLFTPSSDRLTAVRHCNGIDIWIISHDFNSDNFRCYLLTNTGLNLNPIITAIGSFQSSQYAGVGCLKASPNGKKLAMGVYLPSAFELYDFDNTTGVVSNSLSLGTNFTYAYGCEFSPDGSKLYGSEVDQGSDIFQWDLCAGSPNAIVASLNIFTNVTSGSQLQRGPDGKIYIARYMQNQLGVINNPNIAGAGCNINGTQLAISPMNSQNGLPNMPLTRTIPPPFSFTTQCATVNFALPPGIAGGNSGCAASAYTLAGTSWNFGDPTSGNANISSANNPSHLFTSTGTYTVRLVLHYSCGGGTDTLYRVVTPGAAPSLTVSGNLNICAGQSTTLTVSGANTYSWNTSATTSTLVVTPQSSPILTVTGTNTLNSCASTLTVTVNRKECVGVSENLLAGREIKIFPNPVRDILTINVDRPVSIHIYNSIGGLVFTNDIQGGENKVDLSMLEDGIYLIRDNNSKTAQSYKFFKTKQ